MYDINWFYGNMFLQKELNVGFILLIIMLFAEFAMELVTFRVHFVKTTTMHFSVSHFQK